MTITISYTKNLTDPADEGCPPVRFPFCGRGDRRNSDRYAGPKESRASVILDYKSGRGIVVSNYSCFVGAQCKDAYATQVEVETRSDRVKLRSARTLAEESCGGATTPSAARCAQAGPAIGAAYTGTSGVSEPPGANGVLVKVRKNRISLQYRFTNSLGGESFPSPSIDGTIRFATSGNGHVGGGYARNPYPSLEIYQDSPGKPQPLRKSYTREEFGPVWGLDDAWVNLTGSETRDTF